MASTSSAMSFGLPIVPVPHDGFIKYIAGTKAIDIPAAVEPYNIFEAKLREGFAQCRDHKALQDPKVNAVPLFGPGFGRLLVRSRATDDESLNAKYIMPLSKTARKAEGSPATVESMHEFRKNFNLFSESSLVDLDWSNVVAAGSAVVTSLLPVPEKHATSKKALREYYHEQLAPSSDVDLFIWGLDEDEAREKIKQIESSVRNAILEEVTTVRTKNAITLVSHYPVRHVQIVLRLYRSVSEILTGFDVDSSCFAYDGDQVYGTPRGIAAFVTQTNTIDLTRRSPSYESRLSKYAHRGFEIYYPDLDRSRIDPTIFERSFARTVGLARLLVLEQLPKPHDRDEYLAQRREERGRPTKDNGYWYRGCGRPSNFKEIDPDDVAEWVYDDAIADYHSFTVPYGPKYHARKVEKLLYTKDLLMNAEWNHKRDRPVSLHRHPCFLGPIASVMHDCCGSCPTPHTDEEVIIAEEESKIYVSGDLAFMKDDPGRQTIGSFNPLTQDDWTDMAYIGNTEELCQKICDGDIEFVQAWCKANPASIDRRDHTGRTPLHVAVQSSTPEIVECLVDHDARIVARLVDGMTALHIAALRGNAEMVTTLLEQSEENEEREAEKQNATRRSTPSSRPSEERKIEASEAIASDDSSGDGSEDEYDELDGASDEDGYATTEGSIVKVGKKQIADEEALDADDSSEPDIYDINVLAWDAPVSPLHLAILGGHTKVIDILVGQFGADVLLPIKLINSYSKNPEHAIMTLVLAAQLLESKSSSVAKTLLAKGASSAQVDMHQISALHYLVAKSKVLLLKACFDHDGVAVKSALDHPIIDRPYWGRAQAISPLVTAIRNGDKESVLALLERGAKSEIDLDDFAVSYNMAKETNIGRYYWRQEEDVTRLWKESVDQPVLLAIDNDMPGVVGRMIDSGADVNTVDADGQEAIARIAEDSKHPLKGRSLLDRVNAKISDLTAAIEGQLTIPEPPRIANDQKYLGHLPTDSYQYWYISKSIELARNIVTDWDETRKKKLAEQKDKANHDRRHTQLKALKDEYVRLRSQLSRLGAKTLNELLPDQHREPEERQTLEQDPGKIFEPKVVFDSSCTDSVRQGYLELFEAAWSGDAATLKRLTLANWGSDQKHSPLSVSTQDKKGFTPFTLAVYRRHLDLAETILDIANAQHEPRKDNYNRQYTLADSESDGDSDDGSDRPKLSSRILDETYTFDGIAALQQSVGSGVSASAMLSRRDSELWCLLNSDEREANKQLGFHPSDLYIDNCGDTKTFFCNALERRVSYSCKGNLCRYALATKDLNVLQFWLRCCKAATKMKSGDKATYNGVHPIDFLFALQHSNIEILSEMIRFAGVELPLDALAKDAGVSFDDKPKYYQGLSIGGKKKARWARERSGRYPTLAQKTPPLLQAAHQGGLSAVEWFLSDTPLRLYQEYREDNMDNPNLKKMTKVHGGFDKAVGKWLKHNSDLALHGTILSQVNRAKSLSVLKYLLKVFPDSIDLVASTASLPPLALAFLSGRSDAAGLLVNAGADQTTRDFRGKNLIHLALHHISKTSPPDIQTLKALLALIDRRLCPSLMTERCKDGPTGLTPLAYWIYFSSGTVHRWHVANTNDTAKYGPEIFDILSSLPGSFEALGMMDGSGQFPLHQAVKRSYHRLVACMVRVRPDLLSRENAMGQTPLELAESMYIADAAKRSPDIKAARYVPLEKRKVEDFAPKELDDDGVGNGDGTNSTSIRRTWYICRDVAAEHPMKRKLASAAEAREVAKRLANARKVLREREEERQKQAAVEDNDEEEEEGKGKDEVDGWLNGLGIHVDEGMA